MITFDQYISDREKMFHEGSSTPRQFLVSLENPMYGHIASWKTNADALTSDDIQRGQEAGKNIRTDEIGPLMLVLRTGVGGVEIERHPLNDPSDLRRAKGSY